MGPFHDLKNELLGPEALRALQRERLRVLLAELRTNPFYQARFKAAQLNETALAAAALERLPFLTKTELQRDQAAVPPFGTNRTYPLNAYNRFNHSSGTSGAGPLRWLDTPDSWAWMARSWSHIFHAAGVRENDRVCFAFSFGPFLGFWTAYEAATRYGVLAFPAGGMSTHARLRFLLDNGITVVCCTPTYALRMAQTAHEEGINIALSPVRMLIVAGEPGGSVPATRARIAGAWGARCVDHYGMTETGPVSFECPSVPGRMHIIESEFIAECVDPATGVPVADGARGELVLTNLGRLGSPVLRYRTGDVVALRASAPCPCGRSFAALEGGILGRVDDMLVVRGVNVYPTAIEDTIRRLPVAEYRVDVTTVRAMTEIQIRIEADPGEDGLDVARQLSAALTQTLGLRVPVELLPAGTLPRFEMKANRWQIQRES